MPLSDDELNRRRKRREALQAKRAAEQKRMKRMLILAALVLLLCGGGLWYLAGNSEPSDTADNRAEMDYPTFVSAAAEKMASLVLAWVRGY